MSHELVVRGGTVVTATESIRADVGVDGGCVTALAPSLPPGRREVDAAGLLVLPGGVDVHTHLDAEVGGVRSVDDFESGTAAAACGGVTTICDYAWQVRGQSLTAALEGWKTKAVGRAHIDYGFHVIVSDASDRTLAEIPRLVDIGYPSIKVFMINEFGIGDQAMMRVLDAARKVGVVVNVHAENGDMLDHCTRNLLAAGHRDPRYYAASRPPLAEAEATRRAIDYAALVDAEIYIVHLSCADALDAVSAARRRGVRVWAETRPIYLALTEERYAVGGAEAAKFVGAPPLRTDPGDRQRQHLVDGRAEGGGGPGFHPGAVRGARARDRDAGDLLGRGRRRPHLGADLRGRVLDQPGAHLRALSAEGHDRGGQRRRHGPLRSGGPGRGRRAAAPLAGRLRSVQRLRAARRAGADPLPRRGRGPEGPAREPGRPRTSRAPPPDEHGRLSAPATAVHCFA